MVAAATSSSSLPSSHGSPYTGEWEYDAFLCFRGGDTRHGFTSHLMNALSDRQIRAFIDDKLDKTESIDMLISILERSALSVVVFSEKFADSIWCLEEVATIARRMVEYGHRVLPVFYKVDPSDVTDDSRSYATTIDLEYKARSTYLEDKKRWMDALKAVANCAGHTSKAIEIESDLIKAIVEDVQKQLIGMSPSIKDNNLVAMGSRIFELFSLHAFKRDFPQDNWAHKSRLAMSYCKGNPLALKILGGALFGEDRRVKDLIDRSLLTCVSSENGEKIEVHDLLKEMAWNIVNEEPNLGKRSRLMNPEDIHKLLTTQEVKYWPTFSFNPFKIVEMVLPRMEEYRTTEGISLDLSKAKEMYLEANAFDGMDSLTFLKFWYNYSADNKRIRMSHGRINSLPNGLRWLEWHGYPLKSLPSKFYPQHIVHLIISDSPIQRCWEVQPQLVNLMVLDLSCCRNLISIPNISNSLNLEELLLPECESLVEVPSYVQYFTKLIIIDIGGCRNLKLLPPKLDSKLLKHVWMRKLNVTHCPEINSRELEVFDLKGTSLVELPSAIYNVKQDGLLYLSGEDITKLPAITTSLNDYWLDHTSIREMDFLNHHHHHQASSDLALLRFHMMYLTGNSLLESLSKSIWNVVSYQLVIDGSPLIESLPDISEPVNGLTDLCVRNCGGLKSIPSTICNIQSLTRLELRLIGIRSLPSSIQEMKQLVLISLRGCKSLESIPSNIYKLSNLLKLHMTGCESIRSLPELPPNLEELEVSDCKSLQALPSNTGKLLHMDSLQFENCPQLDQTIPAEIVANFLVHASLSLSPEVRKYDCKFPIFCPRFSIPYKPPEGSVESNF
ncbi:Disease resistance protein TAO1 [Linum perenne]